ncbi:MAG: response regulator [Desulfobulbaceae bacterium]|nr:response regulator [Desulfobulbaceae bacterium]
MQATPFNNLQSQQSITDRIENISKIDTATLILLIDLLPISVQVYDPNGIQIAANKKWEERWSLKGEDTVGRLNFFQNEQTLSSDCSKIFKQALSGETVHLPPIELKNKESGFPIKTYLVNRTCYAINDSINKKQYVILVEHDPIEKIQSQQESNPGYFKHNLETNKCTANELAKINNVLQTEITARINTEQLLKEEHNQLLSIFDSIDEAIYVCDPNTYEILYINHKVKKHLGNVIGKKCYKSFQNLDIPCSFCTNKYILGQNKGQTYYWTFKNPILNRTFRCMDKAINWPDGRIVRYEMAIDITDRIKVDNELRQSQKMEAIGTLAAGVAHDFNNILNIILGYAYQAKKLSQGDSVLGHKIEGISSSARRAAELVKQLLSFSRLPNSKKKLFALQPLLKEIIKNNKTSLPSNIAIHSNISPDCKKILCNPIQIQQAITNIITNSHQALKKHGGTITIELKSESISLDLPTSSPGKTKDNFLKLSISDTGSGISPEIKEKMFEPYFTTQEFGKGVGLGLAIVHNIIQSHKGIIKVDSSPEKGTTFNLFLPFNDTYPSRQTTANSPPENHTTPGKRGHILFVDDERLTILNTKASLTDAQYNVSAYTNPLEALKKFHDTPNEFDLVITDHRMPNLTGLDLARRIADLRKNIPIILITGWADNACEAEAKKYRIAKIIKKPYELDQLINDIDYILKKHKQTSALNTKKDYSQNE